MKKEEEKGKKSFFQKINDNTSKLVKLDFIIMGILVFVYALLAFINLGSTQAPKTYYHFINEGEEVGLELDTDKQQVSKMRYYTGLETGTFTILVSDDGNQYTEVGKFNSLNSFAWEDYKMDLEFKYIKFVAEAPNVYLGDVQFYDQYGEKIISKATDEQSKVLTDELNQVPIRITYMNSSYFDEVYFARAAYEYTHGINTIEWVHPPLGKLLMTIPILLFGFSPFAFRLMGTLAGILMIPIIYILAKRLFKNRSCALLAGLLMTFDNFHFTHTRMATVDSFLVLFILLAVLFMKQFIDLEKEAPFKAKARNLLLSGLFMGCAITTKWTGLYAALGLAIVFFAHLFKQNEDKRRKKFNYTMASRFALGGLAILSLIPIAIYYITVLVTNSTTATSITFWYYFAIILVTLFILVIKLLRKNKDLKGIIAVCVIGFIIVPIVIYVLSYMLFPTVFNYTNNSISGIFNQIKDMYTYHSTLTETHPFQSNWYEWPIMAKPVWYYLGEYGGNVKSTIVGIGNPIIWWFGILAFIYTLINTIMKREKETAFILVFILCTFLPYIFIGRAMFLYHYFPTLPFLMLAIVAFIRWISEKLKTNSFYVFYVALVVVVFFVFYPVSSGMITSSNYIDSLKWLSSWIF